MHGEFVLAAIEHRGYSRPDDLPCPRLVRRGDPLKCGGGQVAGYAGAGGRLGEQVRQRAAVELLTLVPMSSAEVAVLTMSIGGKGQQ